MPVHTGDLPGGKPEEKKVEKEVEKLNEKDADVLSAAANSGDADVQNLLAHRAIAELNGDADAIKEIDSKLKDRI
jgi:hypothetical protein